MVRPTSLSTVFVLSTVPVLAVAIVVGAYFIRWTAMQCDLVMSHTSSADAGNAVPHAIPVWMFWDQSPLPETVQLFWNNWCYWCKKCEHVFVPTLVTNATVAQYIDTSAHPCLDPRTTRSPALRSDFIRLALLARYGGVYLDATVLLTGPLDWVLGAEKQSYWQFQAMYNPTNMTIGCDAPVIESSFLFAPPNHPLVTCWLARIMSASDCRDSSLRRVVRGVPRQAWLKPTYHYVYHAMTQLLLEKPLAEYGPYRLYDGAAYRYMVGKLRPLCREHYTAVSYGPLMKFSKRKRSRLIHAVQKNKIAPGSLLDVFLMRLPSQ